MIRALKSNIYLQHLILAGLILATFFRVLSFDFVWDDFTYVINNDLVKVPDSHRRIWIEGQAVDFWPIAWSMFAILWKLFENNSFAYHAYNLAIHVANCSLFFLLLTKLRYRYAFVAAAIFAVHPITVDSVAWMFQAKTTVALLFGLISANFYVDYEQRERWYWLALSAFFFTLSLLTKSSLVMAPFAMLLYNYYRGRKWPFHLAPFFLASLVTGLIAVNWYNNAPLPVLAKRTLMEMIGQAGMVVLFYISKVVVPYPLAFVYADWRHKISAIELYSPLLLYAVLGFLVWKYRKKEWVLWTGLCFATFAILLVPVMGFFGIYYLRYSPVSDHWQYHAFVAILPPLITGFVYLWEKFRVPGLAVFFAALMATYVALTVNHSEVYRTEEAAWVYTLSHDPDSILAHNNYGIMLEKRGNLEAARQHYERVLQLDPDDVEGMTNMGAYFITTKRWKSAETLLKKAISINPNSAKALYNLGVVYSQNEYYSEAIPLYEKALRLDSRIYQARNNLALSLVHEKRFDEALLMYQFVLRIRPEYGEAHFNYANLLERMGKKDQAVQHYMQAARFLPNHPTVKAKIATFK